MSLCRPLNPTGVRRATDRLLHASLPKDAVFPRHVREAREQRFSGLAALHRALNQQRRLESLTACLAEGLADLLQAVTVVRMLPGAERPELVRGGGRWTGADLRVVRGPLAEQAMTQIDALGCDPAVRAAPGGRGSVGHRLLLVPLGQAAGAVGVTLLRRELPFNRDEVACAELLAAQAAAAVARLTATEVAQEQMGATLLRALEARDGATGRHSHRLADYTQALLAQCGMDPDRPEWSDTIRGALLHDVGKIGVSDHALLAPGPLSDGQWQAVRRHAETSYLLLAAVDFLQGAAEVAYAHHERYDGSGYPRGLTGAEIPFGARIFAIADAFDAMTTDRPYRRARSPKAARSEIKRCVGTHFDPALVEIFCRTFDEIMRRMAA